jgi:hypothetical protein
MRKLKSEIDIDVEGDDGEMKTYTLRYDLNALDAFENIYDKSILEVFSPSIDENGTMMTDSKGQPLNLNFRIGMIRNLIYVGLMAHHPEITKEDVGNMFDLNEANENIMPKIADAIALSNRQRFPNEKSGKTGKPPKK